MQEVDCGEWLEHVSLNFGSNKESFFFQKSSETVRSRMFQKACQANKKRLFIVGCFFSTVTLSTIEN